MYSDSDILSVFSYLRETPEGPLRKMLVGGEMSDAHFRVLMKIVRGCGEKEFVEAFNQESVPKIRLSSNETPLKETIWPVSKRKLESLGLLTASAKKAAA